PALAMTLHRQNPPAQNVRAWCKNCRAAEIFPLGRFGTRLKRWQNGGHACALAVAARRGLFWCLPRTAGTQFFVRGARAIPARAVAIDRAFAGRVKRLPGDPRGIVDPGFFRLRIAAGRLSLLDDIAARLPQAPIHLVKLVGVFDLDAEMVETRLSPA